MPSHGTRLRFAFIRSVAQGRRAERQTETIPPRSVARQRRRAGTNFTHIVNTREEGPDHAGPSRDGLGAADTDCRDTGCPTGWWGRRRGTDAHPSGPCRRAAELLSGHPEGQSTNDDGAVADVAGGPDGRSRPAHHHPDRRDGGGTTARGQGAAGVVPWLRVRLGAAEEPATEAPVAGDQPTASPPGPRGRPTRFPRGHLRGPQRQVPDTPASE